MTDLQNEEMAGRIDGVARSLMMLIAHFEESGSLNGEHYSNDLRRFAASRDKAGFVACAKVMQQMAHELDSARHNRSLGR